MPSPARKVPRLWTLTLVVAGAVFAAACGEAEPASDAESRRVIPAAEPAAPASPVTPESAAESAPAEPAPSPETASQEPRAEPVAASRPGAASDAAGDVPEEPGVGHDSGTGVSPEDGPPVDREPLDRTPRPGELDRTDPGSMTRRPTPDVADPSWSVPAGALLALEMRTTLSTEESEPGDRFWATVTEDVLGARGMVLVPRGSRVRGRVLESRESTGPDRPAVLTLLAEELLTEGWTRTLRATAVEVEMNAEARDSDAETVGKIGVGAAAGAVLGKILGGKGDDALKGAVAGAAAGAAVALVTRDGHATIEEGARIVLRLDEPILIY